MSFFVLFCVHDAATHGQYLALSKAWCRCCFSFWFAHPRHSLTFVELTCYRYNEFFSKIFYDKFSLEKRRRSKNFEYSSCVKNFKKCQQYNIDTNPFFLTVGYKIIKVGGNFIKALAKIILHSFFETRCRLYKLYSVSQKTDINS